MILLGQRVFDSDAAVVAADVDEVDALHLVLCLPLQNLAPPPVLKMNADEDDLDDWDDFEIANVDYDGSRHREGVIDAVREDAGDDEDDAAVRQQRGHPDFR